MSDRRSRVTTLAGMFKKHDGLGAVALMAALLIGYLVAVRLW